MAATTGSETIANNQNAPSRIGKKRGKVMTSLHRQFAKNGNEGFSEYQDRYRWFTFHGYFGRMKTPTDQTPKSKERMDLTTSYDKNYVEHRVKPVPKPKPKRYCPPQGKMNTKSDYQECYIKKEPLPINAYAPSIRFRIPPRRTDIETEYQCTYIPLNACRPKAAKMKEGLDISKDKFKGVSTVQHDYREHKNFKRMLPVYQRGRGIGLGGPFTNVTTYRQCYTPKDFKIRPPRGPKPVRRDGPHFTDAIQVDECDPNRSSSMPDYKPAKLDPNPEFESRTTQRSDYKHLPIKRGEKPFWVAELQMKKPQGDMTHDTTYESDFNDPEVVAKVPPMVTLGGRKHMWNDIHVTVADQLPDTTHRSHYTGQAADAAKPFYPHSDNWQASTSGQIPLCTTYKESFMGESHKERTIRRENMKKSLEQSAPDSMATFMMKYGTS